MFSKGPRTSYRINKAIISLLFVGFTMTLIGGCATTADKVDKLDLAARGYEKALRWSKYDMAFAYFKWESTEKPTVPDYINNIRLTKYRVVERNFNEDSMTATQTVMIRYYNLNDLRERRLEDHQKWKYYKEENRWYLTSNPPEFK